MSFSVEAEQYDRFMGRYSAPLAPRFADYAGVTAGQHVLEVGCGPGALTGELLRRLGADAVSAVDPSERFVAAVAERHPEARVERAAADFHDRITVLVRVRRKQRILHILFELRDALFQIGNLRLRHLRARECPPSEAEEGPAGVLGGCGEEQLG